VCVLTGSGFCCVGSWGWHPIDPSVIAVTANVLADEHAACLEAGVDEFLGKPYRAAELSRLVKATPIGPT
jgi:CheY-like chemotaxis protein